MKGDRRVRSFDRRNMKNVKLFYDKTKGLEPNKLLKKVVNEYGICGKAIDLGCGALKDTTFLLEKRV